MINNRFARVTKLLLLPLLILVLSGCSNTAPDQFKRDAREVYDSAMEAYLSGRLEEAEKSFKTIMEDHPLSQYTLSAELMLGDVSYASEKYDDASMYYTNFVALHPAHPKAPYALFQKGMSHMKDVLTLDRDQASARKALFAFEDLITAYPQSPYAEKAREFSGFLKNRLAEHEFYIARFYFKKKNYKGALGRLKEILASYPDGGINDKALFYIGESYLRLGESDLAREAFSTLINNYPESSFTHDAKGRLKAGAA
ncbi:MAG: hypothetical protein A2054_00110 [Deltaproteobacteria bacterium GWA2_55_10]|nr:MAG: hypothetical protein A2054_00110 [Deltaproteobacteria bacterium GWA2_55_10]